MLYASVDHFVGASDLHFQLPNTGVEADVPVDNEKPSPECNWLHRQPAVCTGESERRYISIFRDSQGLEDSLLPFGSGDS